MQATGRSSSWRSATWKPKTPSPEDLYAIGTEVAIARMLRMPDGTASVLTQGRQRVEIVEFTQTEPYYRVRARPIFEPPERPPATEALMRAVLALFEKVTHLNRNLPENAYVFAMNVDEPGWLADLVASTIELEVPERQEVLEVLDPTMRLQRLSILLAKELDVLELENHIHSQVQREVDKSQREFYLREQMKAIQTELGEGDLHQQDISALKQKIADKGLPDEVREKAEKEMERLAAMPAHVAGGRHHPHLPGLAAGIAVGSATEDNLDVSHAAEVLDERHYGLPKAKERILEYIAVRKLAAEKMRSPILCFVGPPGTGKTSLGKSIAEALGRKFVRVSAWAASATRPRFAAIAAPTSARCRAASSRPCAAPRRSTRCSCSTRLTRWATTFGAIRRRRCWKCSTRSRITRSAITTWKCPTI